MLRDSADGLFSTSSAAESIEPDTQINRPFSDIGSILSTLRCMQVPDFGYVSDSLSDAKKDLCRIDGQIKKLEAELIALRMEHKVMRWRVFRLKSLLAPIRKLPPEALAVVFEFFCSEGGQVVGDRILSAPLKIASVCSGWRELARSMPRLWSSFHIDFFLGSDSVSLENLRRFISTHLELSQHCLLDLNVAFNKLPETEIVDFIFESFIPNANRWRNVSFRLPVETFLEQNLAPIKGNLPQLRSLSLRLDGWDTIDFPFCDVFSVAPSLQTLRLTYGASTQLRLPWKQILDHTIQFSSLITALREVFLATEATHITIIRCTHLKSASVPLSITTHRLRWLSIAVDRDDPDFYYWFKWLTLPSLEHLDISGIEARPPESSEYIGEYLSSFLSRSTCMITTLSLVNLSISDVDTISILSSLTSLSTLTIHELCKSGATNKMITTSLLNALTIVEFDKGFSHTKTKNCQHLEHLDLRFHSTLSAKCVIDVVDSRWIPVPKYAALLGVSSLKSVRIQVLVSRDRTEFDMQKLDGAMEVFKVAGLRFHSSQKLLI
ncbi:hypothetical protein VKT23_002671 [Stygiomarasmius scandens]|uniref:F-box domain-containing protein n=1 Tax=Marasmiellus scandens TaxID=2682957 RepID=A0ABR1K333_9AGAR